MFTPAGYKQPELLEDTCGSVGGCQAWLQVYYFIQELNTTDCGSVKAQIFNLSLQLGAECTQDPTLFRLHCVRWL